MPLLSDVFHKARHYRARLAERAVRAFPAATLTVNCTRPIVSFTFDDVPETALTAGAAILEANGVRGTFYIAGSLLGRVEPERRLITAEGCRALAKAGHEIGCHTFSHQAVDTLSHSALIDDLDRNEEVLDTFQASIQQRNFAYPYNRGALRHRHLFADRYDTARAGGDRINRGKVNRSFLWGMEIRQPESDALALVEQIDAVVAEPGWLVFFTHDISETPTPFGCRPSTFRRLVEHAVARGCLVLPVRDALDQIQR